MKILRVLDSSGDRMITFDQTKATTQARTEAQALFERLLANGSSAFKVNRADGKPDEKVTEFSTLENETIVVPRVVGGRFNDRTGRTHLNAQTGSVATRILGCKDGLLFAPDASAFWAASGEVETGLDESTGRSLGRQEHYLNAFFSCRPAFYVSPGPSGIPRETG